MFQKGQKVFPQIPHALSDKNETKQKNQSKDQTKCAVTESTGEAVPSVPCLGHSRWPGMPLTAKESKSRRLPVENKHIVSLFGQQTCPLRSQLMSTAQ